MAGPIPTPKPIVIQPKPSTGTKTYAYVDGKKVLAANAKRMWLNLDDASRQAVIEYTTSIGRKPDYAKTIWGQLVDASTQAMSTGVLKTPFQVLQDLRGQQPTTYTTTSKESYSPDAQTSAINNTYVKLIGRLATQDEINAIITAANAQPGTTNKTTYTAGGSTTVSSPDLTPEQIASQQLLTSSQYQPERQRQQNLSFATWLDTAMRGGQQATAGLANG
jgi:hypothetical protein